MRSAPVLALAAVCAFGATHAVEPVRTPDIVFFVADDLGRGDAGYLGNRVVPTPNLDRLAGRSHVFTQASATAPMCAPSRSSLLTGLYPVRNGCFMNHGDMRADVRTLPKLLGQAGYRSGQHGKMHVGPPEVLGWDVIPPQSNKWGTVYVLDLPRIQGWLAGPSFLWVASGDPHPPHGEDAPVAPADIPLSPHLIDTPRTREAQAHYYGDIARMDRELGELITGLEKAGRFDDCLFVFLSDNGNGPFAKWTCYEAGLNMPLVVKLPRQRQGKVIPSLVSFVDLAPTVLAAAGRTDLAAGMDGVDLHPLMAGTVDRVHQYVFGLHTTRGTGQLTPRVAADYAYPTRSVRDLRWKYIRNLAAPETTWFNYLSDRKSAADDAATEAKRQSYWDSYVGSWRDAAAADTSLLPRLEHLEQRPAEELYDLASDPWEKVNLAADPAHQAERERLAAALDAWMRQQGDLGIATERTAPLTRQGPTN